MSDRKKINAAKTALGLTAAAGGLYLLVGEIIYEGVLNKHLLHIKKNVYRQIEPELAQYYDEDPESYPTGDSWYTATNPDTTSVVTSDGETIHSVIIEAAEPTDVWAIVIHGYSSCPRGMADQAFGFRKMGYNVLLPCLRAHGPDTHSHCSMGYYDRYMVLEWINYIRSINPDAKILLLGVSMGSATTMLVTGEDLPDNVKCAIADCGYTNCWDEYTVQIGEMFGLPVFPFLYAANTVSKLRGNFDFRKCSPIDAVAKSKTPTLFIHGEKDTFVPFQMMDKVYNACTAEKEKLIIPDAMHAEAVNIHPDMYWKKIEEFLAKYL